MDAPTGDDGFFTESLATRDPELFAAVADELTRQQDEIELIASENIVSRAVLEAQGSVLTNKYAEGYPGRRSYGGCQHVDVAERPASGRAAKRFGSAFGNGPPNPAPAEGNCCTLLWQEHTEKHAAEHTG